MLTQDETRQLIELLAKASPRDSLAGSYTVIVSPTFYSPDDFIPRNRVYVDDVTNAVDILNVEDVMDAQAMEIKKIITCYVHRLWIVVAQRRANIRQQHIGSVLQT